MRLLIVLASLVAVGYGIVQWRAQRAESWPAGDYIHAEPKQTPTDAAAFAYKTFRIQPLARFEMEARALHTMSYRFDEGAALVPVDVAFAWGRTSDQRVLDQLDIGQGARFYTWRYEGEPPLPPAEISASSANMHLIPADAGVAKRIATIHPGQRIWLKGYLVEASRDDGWHWRSSLTRLDTGNGACELVYVEDIELR